MIRNAPLFTGEGDLTRVPHANDNVPSELRPLAVAMGKVPANDNLPPVVAFTGLAGAGKSTAMRHLVERHGYRLVKFAGPLKDMMRAIGMTEDEIEGGLKEQPSATLLGKTPRHAMQTLGTEWGRNCIGEDLWISLWRRRVEEAVAGGNRVVVDDCRFPNEAKAIRTFGGKIYLLAGRGGIAGNHSSESGCGDMDAVLVNLGSIDELHDMVDDALRRVA
ncbi:deoxynucleotide monophosphate kinase [Rhizobium sp. RCAM05973]|uniref:deoxynucleotide monophosphate kinase family protein n=1 Tax=Rhizobium sp. RCAM05973 TaxID=2994066 RepID=UPI0022EBD145|nr:deoxynucleotide monophosphate kinase [Rhizobium sp. RCAM05973]